MGGGSNGRQKCQGKEIQTEVTLPRYSLLQYYPICISLRFQFLTAVAGQARDIASTMGAINPYRIRASCSKPVLRWCRSRLPPPSCPSTAHQGCCHVYRPVCLCTLGPPTIVYCRRQDCSNFCCEMSLAWAFSFANESCLNGAPLFRKGEVIELAQGGGAALSIVELVGPARLLLHFDIVGAFIPKI